MSNVIRLSEPEPTNEDRVDAVKCVLADLSDLMASMDEHGDTSDYALIAMWRYLHKAQSVVRPVVLRQE